MKLYEKNTYNKIETAGNVNKNLLSKYKKNILNWYPFEAESSVLELGGKTGEITEIFTQKCREVVTIEPELEKSKIIKEKNKNINNIEIITDNLKNAKLIKKFDYIVMIGIDERIEKIYGEDIQLNEFVKKIERFLKPTGKLLIAVDNKFGLKFFAGDADNILNKKFCSLIGYNNEEKKIETFTKNKLQEILKNNGYKTNFYYPLPDYKMTDVIFSDKYLPTYTSIDKYNPYHTEKSTVIFNEIDVFREILKSNKEMFSFFANSFLIEASKEDINYKFRYISFNNLRKDKYQLITKISNNFVEKEIANQEALQHYENIKNNIRLLNDSKIKVTDYIENGKIKSKYIEQKYLLNNVLVELMEKNKMQEFYQVIDGFIKAIDINTYIETDYSNTIFNMYNIDIENKELIKELHFVKNGLWDMTFKNCFFKDGEFIFFDQEWNKPNLPYEYILYRSILYTISLRRFIKIDELYKKYNIDKYLNIFKQLDDKLQEEIRDEEICNLYIKNNFINIDETKQELINLNIRNKAMQSAIDNFKKENEHIKEENEYIKREYENYKKNIESRTCYKIYKKLKRLTGGKNGKKD